MVTTHHEIPQQLGEARGILGTQCIHHPFLKSQFRGPSMKEGHEAAVNAASSGQYRELHTRESKKKVLAGLWYIVTTSSITEPKRLLFA